MPYFLTFQCFIIFIFMMSADFFVLRTLKIDYIHYNAFTSSSVVIFLFNRSFFVKIIPVTAFSRTPLHRRRGYHSRS